MSNSKKEKILCGLKDSINLYLIKNIDRLGFCHVGEIDISNDLKNAKIYIGFIDNTESTEKIKYLNNNTKGIFNEYNKMYSSKLFPSIKIYSFNDELNI